MTSAEVRNRFRGVFGFPITPFRQDLSLDLDGLARNVGPKWSRHPFCALVAAGGTGELYLADRCRNRRCRARHGARRPPDACPWSPVWATTRRWAQRWRAEWKKPARIVCWCCRLTTSNAPEEGLFDYYEAIGQRERPAADGLQPRLGRILAADGGAPRRARAHACWLEGRPGRRAQVSAHHESCGRPAGVAGRHWRRLRAGLLRHRRAGLHIEHLEYCARRFLCSWPKRAWRGISRGSISSCAATSIRSTPCATGCAATKSPS